MVHKKKKKKRTLFHKVYIPETTQDMIAYLFKEVDEKTGIFRITEDEYSICMEYSDVSFAKANDEDAENIFFKWLEYLHSFREDTHIEVVNAGTPIKTERYKERFIFDSSIVDDPKQKQIAEELNMEIEKTLGSKEDTLQNKRYIVISLKAKNFEEANALFLNIYLKTEKKFKELKSKVRIVSVKERLEFIHNIINIQTLEDRRP